MNTCSNCEFKCPSRWIDFYTDGIAFPGENKKVTWWTTVLWFWIRSVIFQYSTLLPSSNTTSMLSMLQLSSSMDYDNFRWSPQSSTDGWSLSVELNHNDSVLAIEITFEDFVEDMSNICYRSETWISASLVVSIFRHAWPPTCEAKSKIICIWGNVLANFTNSTTHFFFFRQNTRFPSTFLEKFPEKFELQTCETKKSSRNQKCWANKDSFWLQRRLILVSGKTIIPGSYRVIKNSVRKNLILCSPRILPAFWLQHPPCWRRQICAQFGGREIAMTYRFPNSPLSFRYHDDESSRSEQFRPLHHEGPASSTIC